MHIAAGFGNLLTFSLKTTSSSIASRCALGFALAMMLNANVSHACEDDFVAYKAQSNGVAVMGVDSCDGPKGVSLSVGGQTFPAFQDLQGGFQALVPNALAGQSAFLEKSDGSRQSITIPGVSPGPNPANNPSRPAVAQNTSVVNKALPVQTGPLDLASINLDQAFDGEDGAETSADGESDDTKQLWNMWKREEQMLAGALGDGYDPSGNWFNDVNQHHEGGAASAVSGKGPPMTIDLLWASQLDLDLHIFEPKSQRSLAMNAQTPGHLWVGLDPKNVERSMGRLRSLPFDQARGFAAERYRISGKHGKGLRRPLFVYVDYADRTKRGNRDPRTCDNGAFATVKAMLRVSGPSGRKEFPLQIPPIRCGTPVDKVKSLVPITKVAYK